MSEIGGIDDVRDRQGWNDETMLELAERFIQQNGLGPKYQEYLDVLADEENAECGDEPDEDDDEEFDEPGEEDWVTEDHRLFRQLGTNNLIHVPEADDWRKVLNARMEKDQFWPNVWFISDHGNAHLLSLNDDRKEEL